MMRPKTTSTLDDRGEALFRDIAESICAFLTSEGSLGTPSTESHLMALAVAASSLALLAKESAIDEVGAAVTLYDGVAASVRKSYFEQPKREDMALSETMIGRRTTAMRRLNFCAGHRVLNHEGKCATPHGHEYTVYIHAESDGLDAIGRVIDFSVLKDRIGGWIEANWDHRFLCNAEDWRLLGALRRVAADEGGRDPWEAPFNPTAEEIARFLLETVCPSALEGTGVRVVRVEVWETPNCKAESWKP